MSLTIPLDTVTELFAEGNDTVQTTLDADDAGANVENLTLSGAANLAGYGNELDNVLTGNRAITFAGGAGNDRLDGGLGGDTLTGGTGDDIYVVDNTGDRDRSGGRRHRYRQGNRQPCACGKMWKI